MSKLTANIVLSMGVGFLWHWKPEVGAYALCLLTLNAADRVLKRLGAE